VPINEQDKAWIRETIQTALKTRGLGRLARLLREWSGTGAAVAILILGLTQWTAYIEFRTNTKNSFDSSEKRLTAIEGQLAKQNIVSHVSLTPSAFKSSLQELRSSIATVKEQKIAIANDVLDDLGHKLVATDSEAQAYWPTAGELISYHSSLLMSPSQVRATLYFPVCQDPSDIFVYQGPADHPNATGIIKKDPGHDCAVQLDGKTISGWECKHCLVKYSGGPLSLHNVHFEDSLFVFEFPADQSPSPGGQRLSTTLLASNLTDVEIPSA
jgi:hypothetical protein